MPAFVGSVEITATRTEATVRILGRNTESAVVRLPEPIVMWVEIRFKMCFKVGCGMSRILTGYVPRRP